MARQAIKTDGQMSDETEKIVKVGAISGFPEWLPEERIAELRLLDTIRETYERFGFAPIETAAVERQDVLTAKGGVQRQIFGLNRPADDAEDGARQALALHFDLTVPTARYVVQNERDLSFPWRRYQHQKVWRGERAQRGRFREFAQFDIDIIGREKLDELHDAEVVVVTARVLEELGLGDAEIHLSHRGVLGALTEAAGIGSSDKILATVDRVARAGKESVLAELAELGTPGHLVDSVEALLDASGVEEVREVLQDAGASVDGVTSLQRIVESAVTLGAPPERLILDFSIARGLDYYTGIVIETFVPGHEAWGSICSGGRYDNLAGHFGSRQFPGVGVSIGVTRLFDLLRKAGRIEVGAASPASVLVSAMDRDRFLPEYLEIAQRLRAAGYNTESYLQDRRLKDQLADAAAKGILLVVIAGEDEFAAGEVAIKNMRTGVQDTVALDELEKKIGEELAEMEVKS